MFHTWLHARSFFVSTTCRSHIVNRVFDRCDSTFRQEGMQIMKTIHYEGTWTLGHLCYRQIGYSMWNDRAWWFLYFGPFRFKVWKLIAFYGFCCHSLFSLREFVHEQLHLILIDSWINFLFASLVRGYLQKLVCSVWLFVVIRRIQYLFLNLSQTQISIGFTVMSFLACIKIFKSTIYYLNISLRNLRASTIFV